MYLSSLTMTNSECVVEFDNHQIVIRECIHDHGQALAKGMQECSLYWLLIDSM